MFRVWTACQSRFVRDRKGATMVEYAVLVALIAVVVIAAALVLRRADQREVQRGRGHVGGLLNRTDSASAGSLPKVGVARSKVTPASW